MVFRYLYQIILQFQLIFHSLNVWQLNVFNPSLSQSTDSTTRLEFLSPTMQDMYYYCLPFLYGFTHLCKVGSVFTTLAVSLERYFAVCHPLWIRIRRCPPAMYIILVTVFAFAFNIPKFLEFEVSFFVFMIELEYLPTIVFELKYSIEGR